MESLERIAQRLGSLRSTIRLFFTIDWLGRSLLFASMFLIGLFVVDFLFILPLGLRVILELGALGVLVYLLAFRLIRPLALRISDDDLALLVEREYPHLKDRLISSIQLGRSREENPAFNSPELIDRLIAETTQEAQGIQLGRIVTPRFVIRPLMVSLILAGCLVAAAFTYPVHASIFLKRLFGDAKWPAETDLKVLGFGPDRRLVVARGDDVAIQVLAERKIPKRVYLNYEFLKPREKGSEKMTPLPDNKFLYTFTAVPAPFEFTVGTRDVETELHRVDILDPPDLRNPELFFTYPQYLHLKNTPAELPETNPNLKVPMFTKVKFVSTCTQDVGEVELWLGLKGQEKVTKLQAQKDAEGRPRRVAVEFDVDAENSEYSLRVKSVDGLWNRDPMRYSIKGLPDQKPVITVLRPRSAVEEVTKDCLKNIRLVVEDDYGIKIVRMYFRVLTDTAKPDWMSKTFGEKEIFPPNYGEKKLSVEDRLELAMLAVKEKDVVEIKFAAEDYKDVGDKNLFETKPFQLRIVSLDELEKKLEGEIERLKADLKKLQSRQSTLQNRTDFLKSKYISKPDITADERAEIRDVSINQNEVTTKLEQVARDLDLVMERGLENKLFDEHSAAALRRAIEILQSLSTTTTNPPGCSYDAAQKLLSASKSKSESSRDQAFLEARRLQGESYEGISAALESLERWATFQEAVRIAREIFMKMKDHKDKIGIMRACKDCKVGRCAIHKLK
jgi:uncharacterized small protein (DUF1192 family)